MKLSVKIDVPEDGDALLNPFPESAVEKLEAALAEEIALLCPGLAGYAEAEISVSFLDSPEMREINRQYREADEPTDVLAFPLWEDGRFAPPAIGVLPLGDVVICPERTEKEHQDMTRSEALCLVLAHGFLHLLGWDHDAPEKEAAMWERQDILKAKLLDAVGESF